MFCKSNRIWGLCQLCVRDYPEVCMGLPWMMERFTLKCVGNYPGGIGHLEPKRVWDYPEVCTGLPGKVDVITQRVYGITPLEA